MLLTSKIRTRRFAVLKEFKEPDDEFIRPLLKHRNASHGWAETQGTVDDDDGAVPSGADWPIKAVGTAAQKGSKRRAKRVMNVIGRAVGSALIPDLRETRGKQRQKMTANVQLAYPPFMLSAGVFMFAF